MALQVFWSDFGQWNVRWIYYGKLIPLLEARIEPALALKYLIYTWEQ